MLDLHAPLELVLTTALVPAEVARELAAAAGLELTDELGSPVPGALRDWLGDGGVPCITYEVEHAGLPALYRAAPAGARRVHANARNVARLIATVSSMRSA